MPTLPDKRSALLRLALEDLEAVERDPRYVVNMGRWHGPIGDVCHVCLAGSVMAMTLGPLCLEDDVTPAEFSDDVYDKLSDLNSLRTSDWGDVSGLTPQAVEALKREFKVRWVAMYSADPAQFKADMNRVADILEQHGC